MKETPLRLALDNSLDNLYLYQDEIRDEVEYGISELHFGYSIDPFEFIGEKKSKCNGCEFRINPGGSTDVVEIKINVSMIEASVDGSGWLLYADPDGKVGKYYFNHKLQINSSISFELPIGSISVWIADNEEIFRVVNITEPPYQPGMEIFYSENDPQVTDEFWQNYWNLKQ